MQPHTRRRAPDEALLEMSMQGLKAALLQIWRLAYPYFASRDRAEVRIWPFGSITVQERWAGIGLAATVVAIEFAQVAINVRLSYFNRDWFNAIQDKKESVFWTLLLTVFCFWAAVFVASAILQYVLQSYLRIRWRRWMTERYVARWLDGNTHYRMQLAGRSADNPDQRIADDIDQFVFRTQDIALRIIGTISTLISFSVILWQNSQDFVIPGTELKVPGFLLWGALIYSVVFTWITHLIGKPLVRLNFEQQRYEADFRFSLARLREYSEQVALLDGSRAEKEQAGRRFSGVIGNFLAIVSRQKKLTAFIASYQQVNAVIPYVLVAPYYFAGLIPLGVMTQTAGAFGRVEANLSFFITLYTTLADYKAVADRLTSFDTAMVESASVSGAQPSVGTLADRQVKIDGLRLWLPNGRQVVGIDELLLREGQKALLAGPSGSGKSTLFRAIAGIWPYGEGLVATPAGAKLMLLPQRPYIPMGTLRSAVTYPGVEGTYTDAEIAAALEAARLPMLVDCIADEALWSQTLSLGEQQRVAIARALLARPDWLFLDEATAALDEPTEEAIYRVLGEKLPGTTLVSIGHRSTLATFHDRRLEMQARGDGTFGIGEVRMPAAAQ
jgi:vitamin B12/bleomycin/antimicrobial peptide transport system ATP-binding/permease protein